MGLCQNLFGTAPFSIVRIHKVKVLRLRLKRAEVRDRRRMSHNAVFFA